MKSLFNISLLVLAVVLFSCKEDDPEPVNIVTYDGKGYQMTNGYVLDYGSDDDFPFYNYDFLVSDGTFDIDDEQIDGKVIVYCELFSPSEESFKTGTFNYIDPSTTNAEDVEGEFVMPFGFILSDTNDDGVIDSDDDNEVEVSGGSVTVTGTDYDYTLTYDLKLVNGKTVTGSFSGTFSYSDEK